MIIVIRSLPSRKKAYLENGISSDLQVLKFHFIYLLASAGDFVHVEYLVWARANFTPL